METGGSTETLQPYCRSNYKDFRLPCVSYLCQIWGEILMCNLKKFLVFEYFWAQVLDWCTTNELFFSTVCLLLLLLTSTLCGEAILTSCKDSEGGCLKPIPLVAMLHWAPHTKKQITFQSVKLLSAVFDAWSLFPATTVPWSQASDGLAAQRINLLSHTCHVDFRLLGEQWLPSGSFNRCMCFLQILVTRRESTLASKHDSNVCLLW